MTSSFSLLHQVRIPWKGMRAVGRGSPFRLAVGLQPMLAHEARYPLVVDGPSLTSQLVGDPPIGIAWLRRCHLFERLQQPMLLRCCWSVIVATTSAAYDLAHHAHGILLGHHGDHRPFLLKGELKSPETFLAMSNSIVSRPTSRSSSAIRSYSALRFWSCSKTSGAGSRNSLFQRASTCGMS